MANVKTKPYSKVVKSLMGEKSTVLSKAHALAQMGMAETALPLWESAAGYEERLAPLLEALGRNREAAIHRISAASCYQRAGDLSRAANLYRAALAGPLPKKARQEVQEMLADCLSQLTRAASNANGPRRARQATTKV